MVTHELVVPKKTPNSVQIYWDGGKEYEQGRTKADAEQLKRIRMKEEGLGKSAPKLTPNSMAGMRASAISTLSRVALESSGEGWMRPYTTLPMAPAATTECDRPVHSFRSNPSPTFIAGT